MTRDEMIRALLANLPAGSDSIDHPDHPLLLRGPDVLTSYRSSLTAYFVIARSTRSIINETLSAALLTRLALPPTTRLVLIMTETTDLAAEVSWLFDEVAEANPRHELTVPIGGLPVSDVADVLEALRAPHHDRFAEAWAPATRGRRFAREKPGEPTSLYGLTREAVLYDGNDQLESANGGGGPRIRSQYMDFDNGEFYFNPPDSVTGARMSTLVTHAAATAVNVDYSLELGFSGLGAVAGLVQSREAHLALHHGNIFVNVQTRRFDATKPLRAAAFAGFAPY
jgi:hypothetical protein